MACINPETLLTELTRVEQARSPQAGRSGANRRQFARHSVRGEAELHPVGRNRINSSPIEIQLRDVGSAGLGFVYSERLPVGSSWRVNFFCRGYIIGSQSLVVRHCTRIGEGLYLMGSQFVLDAGVLAALGVDMSEFEGEDTFDELDDLASQFTAPELE